MQTETTNSLEEMARQTAQAKLLREARDELAGKAPQMGKAWMIANGLTEKRAKAILEGAQFNTEDLADLLGVSLPTLRSWINPPTNDTHRPMSTTAQRLLARILADEPKRKA